MGVKGYCHTARSVWKRARVKMSELECIGSTHGNLLSDKTMDDCVPRQAASGREQHVRWWGLLQVSAAHTYPLLAYGLTVKLSPCPCSPAGWVATCQHVWSTTCGYPKRNLLPAQAHPWMKQHLSSKIIIEYPKWLISSWAHEVLQETGAWTGVW